MLLLNGGAVVTDSGDAPSAEIIFLCMILVGMLVFGTVGVWLIRKWMARTDDTPAKGFTFSDLRQLHKEGKITDAEFERVRAKLGGKVSGRSGGAGPGKGPAGGGQTAGDQ
jgi:hypothetical protein